MLVSAYRGTERYSAYSPSGQRVFDVGISNANGSATHDRGDLPHQHLVDGPGNGQRAGVVWLRRGLDSA